MTDSRLTLSAHGFTAVIVPAHGATITRIVWTGPDGRLRDLLHSPPDTVSGAAPRNRFGVWPLVPFANRAFGAVLDDGETRFALPVNDGAGGTIHGFGWQAAWAIDGQDENSLALVHRREAGPDPFRYLARMVLTLEPDRVRLSLAVTNEAQRAMPFGLGLHPWFAATPETVIRAAARGELALGEGYRPGGFTSWRDGGPYAEGCRRPPAAEIAHSLVDWMGEAVIDNPAHGLRISIDASPNLRHPVLWSPPDADFVCFEPQTHGIGAASEAAARNVTPLTRLQPGATLAGSMTLRPGLL